MPIKNVNTYFCDAVRAVILKVLSEDGIFVQLVFPKKGPEKLMELYRNLSDMIQASKKTTVLVRYGERYIDME